MPYYNINPMLNMNQYAKLVIYYNDRKLDSDGLAAFSGVLEAYSPLLPGRFLPKHAKIVLEHHALMAASEVGPTANIKGYSTILFPKLVQ